MSRTAPPTESPTAPRIEPEEHPLPAVDPLAEAPLTEQSVRRLPGWLAWGALLGLVAMSSFHLFTGSFGEFPAMVQRSVHLAFAMGLALLLFPARWAEHVHSIVRGVVRLVCWVVRPLRSRRDGALVGLDGTLAGWQAMRGRRPWRGVIVAGEVGLLALALFSTFYVAWLHEDLARRSGAPTTLDLVVSGLGVAMVLEATRRSISPALFYVTLGFLAYAFFGHWSILPPQIRHYELMPTSVLEDLYLTHNGVFGIPLKVSSTFVVLFVLFGAVLDRSGAGRYLIDLAFATMGRFRGGPAKAAVLASGLMGTISGSSIANTVTTGSLTIPLMKKAGFRPHVAGAVEVAASTNGQLMPPVMGAAAFIMAEITGIPYSTIIIAALLPALLSYTVIFTMIHLEALRTGIQPSDRADMPSLKHTLLRGIHLNIPILAILILLLGVPEAMRQWAAPVVDLGRRTPTTAATLTIWLTFGLFVLIALLARPTAYGMQGLLRQRDKRLCRSCGYDLRGSASAGRTECPECGASMTDEQVAHLRGMRIEPPASAGGYGDKARAGDTEHAGAEKQPSAEAEGSPHASPPGGYQLGRRARHFGVRSVQALRDGALNMVGIACACACCGIIIGVVGQTGLGFKIIDLIEYLSSGASGLVHTLAGLVGADAESWASAAGLLTALVFTAMACILLGVGLPTTATYIIMASLIAPAILALAGSGVGVPGQTLLLATHLFVFYYGILADDTPPVGLCAYAASGIAGADPIRTGLASFRMDLGAFLLPLVFFFNRELLLQDVTVWQVLWVLPGAIMGMMCFAAALQGYAWDHLRWWQRGLLLAVAFLLVKPSLLTTVVGLAVLGALYVGHRLALRTAKAADVR